MVPSLISFWIKTHIILILGGFYQKYSNSGLAIPGAIKSVEYLLQSNPSRIITYISANNCNSLINNLASGLKDVTRVMIK